MKEMQNAVIVSFMIVNNSISYLKGTVRVPGEFWSPGMPGRVGWMRLWLFGELLEEKTGSRYFSTPLLRSQGSISELRNYIIRLHLVITHQVASTGFPLACSSRPWRRDVSFEQLKASPMQNTRGVGGGQSFCRACLTTLCGSLLPNLHYRKTIFYLFKLEIPLHLNFKCAANTLWSF